MKEGWTYKKLGEICDIYQPKTLSSNMLLPDGKYAVYGANGIIGRYDKYNHESSEVLMTCRGATCGTINVSEPFSWINGNAMVIHPQSDELNKAYLVYVIKGIDLSNVITGAAQPQITRQSLSPTKIPIPPIAEQERIVAELDLLSGIIEKKKEQLKAYDQLAQSIFYTMFGDPIDNPKGWETMKLRDVCHHITDGDHMPPPKSDNGIPFLTISNVNKDKQELDFSNTFFVPQEYYDNLKDERKARINLLKPIQEKVLTSFLFYWALCPSIKEEADSVATGIAQKTVGLNSLRQFNVILPPLSLQQEFAEKVEAIERQKALVQQSIDETQTMFDYTMDKYFG